MSKIIEFSLWNLISFTLSSAIYSSHQYLDHIWCFSLGILPFKREEGHCLVMCTQGLSSVYALSPGFPWLLEDLGQAQSIKCLSHRWNYDFQRCHGQSVKDTGHSAERKVVQKEDSTHQYLGPTKQAARSQSLWSGERKRLLRNQSCSNKLNCPNKSNYHSLALGFLV